MNNFWGPQDDEYEDFPDWMLPPSKRRVQAPNPSAKSAASLNEAIQAALKKPTVQITIQQPNENDLKND